MSFVFMENTWLDWSIAVGATIIFALLIHAIRARITQRIAGLSGSGQGYTSFIAVMLAMIASTSLLFIFVAAAYIGSKFLELPPAKVILLSRIFIAALLIQAAMWGDAGIRTWLEHYRARKIGADAASITSTAALGFIARGALWLVVILMILDNMGVDITTLIASLGIGGIAVALALQNILGDIFASLSIVLDKPFVVGDFIIVDDAMGTVEYVGLKTTRVRSLNGEQVIFSNTDLLKSRIHNYKRMQTRRIVFSIGVTYQTTESQLRAIPGIIRDLVLAQPNTTFDRAHFLGFGESALTFEVVYNMTNPDYNIYMDTQQAINLGLFKRFATEGIEFAHPTRTLHIVKGQEAEDSAGRQRTI